MTRYEVYVNDQLIDLDPRSIVGLTLQANAIASGDLVNRRASYTNQIKVPRTTRNAGVFGAAHIIGSATTVPYVRNSCRVNCNGLEILTGVAIVKGFNEFFALNILSMPKDLDLAVGTKVLDELDFGDSPITWNQSYMDSVRASTTGICAPVINYGQLDFFGTSIGDYYLPSVSYKDILTQILTEAGYTVSGTFYTSDAIFNAMVMSYGRREWPGTSFKINEILPDDIRQKDFLTDFMVKFGAYFRITGLDVEILTMQSIITDKVTTNQDWSTKRANKKEALAYDWQDWAQVNNFLYSRDSPTYNPVNFYSSDGSILCNNVNIAADREVYTSLFDPTSPARVLLDVASNSVGDFYCATQEIYSTLPAGFVFDNDPKPMLLILRDRVAADGATMTYNGNARADFKVAYHNWSWGGSSVQDMKWRNSASKGLLDIYYPALETALQNPKMVKRQYVLTDIDIYGLDLLTPVFDEAEYFLIAKVGPYVSGRNTDVDLLRI